MAVLRGTFITLFMLLSMAAATAQDAKTTTAESGTKAGVTEQKSSPATKPIAPTATGNNPGGKEEEHPGPAKPELPNAASEQVRLTPHQKFQTFVKRTYSPYTFASAATSATWAQMWGDYYGYGGGMQGWSKRFGASVANAEIRSFFSSFALPVFFKQDPRYHTSRKRGVMPRSWYAATRVFVTRSDDNRKVFNWSEVLGVLFTSSIQNSYYPRRDRGAGETMYRFSGGLGADATSNLLREFSPEIKAIAKKIVPKPAQKLEKKIPEPVMKGMGLPQ